VQVADEMNEMIDVERKSWISWVEVEFKYQCWRLHSEMHSRCMQSSRETRNPDVHLTNFSRNPWLC
jgi:hypothetical protein